MITRSIGIYEGIGKTVIRLRHEVTGHLVNRLQAAVFREAVHLVATGVATVQDVDRGIAYGPAMRWPFTGIFRTWHLAGGPGGARDYLAKLAPSIESLWRVLGDAHLSTEVCERIALQLQDADDGRTIDELTAARDQLLAQFLRWMDSRQRLV
jgi:3-hydroxybutyryl-CoA dehydrogenase